MKLWTWIVREVVDTDWLIAAACVVAVLLAFAYPGMAHSKSLIRSEVTVGDEQWVSLNNGEVMVSDKIGAGIDDRGNKMMLAIIRRIGMGQEIFGVRMVDCPKGHGDYALYSMDGQVVQTGKWGNKRDYASVIGAALCYAFDLGGGNQLDKF